MKNIKITMITAAIFFSCNSRERPAYAKKTKAEAAVNSTIDMPFVGKRMFETRPGVSGTGTPHKFVEILANGDVFFSFEQENQSDGTISKERFYAGKYTTYITCSFEKLNSKTFYEFTKEAIYEVDGQHNRVKNEECCGLTEEADKEGCMCDGEFLTLED
ncbi:MAG: hypothetical protein V4649_10395 [Bacteroidota bacterium]